jgi:acyl carrier protein
MEQIEREVRQFVIDNFLFGEGETQFSNDDSFLEKGLVDSMGILTLVAFVQDKYAITVADEELVPKNWDSIKRITGFVQGKSSMTR